MSKTKLTYAQLRDILSLIVKNEPIRLRVEDLIRGKLVNITEIELIDMVVDSGVDKDMIRIMSGQDPEQMDAVDGLEQIADFFGYMKANKERLAGWLSSFGLRAQGQVKSTRSKPSK